MTNKRRHKSTLARALRIKALTALHYEEGNQAKCYKAVWRRWIEPEFGITYGTYLRLLDLEPSIDNRYGDSPSLFDNT